jgi:hypothetical protein
LSPRRFNTCFEVMVAGAGQDTGRAKERRRLAFPAEEVADERDEMVLENLEATFGSEAGGRRHLHSQRLGIESPPHSDEPFNLPSKCIRYIRRMLITVIKIKRGEGVVKGAVDL